MCEWHGPTLRDAALRELRRGGQIYLVHNEVQSIEKVAAEFAALVPEAQVRFGHGQMRERELEQLMVDFYHRRFNVLVCTTIIESGIDVPSANTILIDRADRLGLAQLHQLRGPRGPLPPSRLRLPDRALAPRAEPAMRPSGSRRSNRWKSWAPASCSPRTILRSVARASSSANARRASSPRSGSRCTSTCSSRRSVRSVPVARHRSSGRWRPSAKWSCTCPALLPEDYVPDVHLRLALYQRIAGASAPELADMTGELIDRFGPLPPPANHLLQLAAIRLRARELGIRRLDLGPQGGSVMFEAQNRIDAAAVIRLLQRPARDYRMEGPLKLRFSRGLSAIAARFDFATQLLEELSGVTGR